MRAETSLDRLLRLLIPPRCLLCRAFTRGPLDLCGHCRGTLPWNFNACARCGLALVDSISSLCGACLGQPPEFTQVVAPLKFEAAAADLIRTVKFGDDLSVARLLALLLTETVADRYPDSLPELVIPVPLHWRRLIRRGHNQAALLARVVGRQLQLPVAYDAVRRVRATPPQTGLDRQARRTNLRGAFRVQRPLPHRSVAVIDDVLTTGSTLTELTGTLARAGVEEVHVWVVARTQAPVTETKKANGFRGRADP